MSDIYATRVCRANRECVYYKYLTVQKWAIANKSSETAFLITGGLLRGSLDVRIYGKISWRSICPVRRAIGIHRDTRGSPFVRGKPRGMSRSSMRYGGNRRLPTYVDNRAEISHIRWPDTIDMRRMSSGMPDSRVWYDRPSVLLLVPSAAIWHQYSWRRYQIGGISFRATIEDRIYPGIFM